MAVDTKHTWLHLFAMSLLGGGMEVGRICTDIPTHAFTPEQLINLTISRAGNLLFNLGRLRDAEHVIDDAATSFATQPARELGALTAFRTSIDVFKGNFRAALDSAITTLDDPDITDLALMVGALGALGAVAHLGRADLADAIAVRACDTAQRSPEAAPLLIGVTLSHVVALQLAGYLSAAESVAHRLSSQSADLPVIFSVYGTTVLGEADLHAGRVEQAAQRLRDSVRGYETSAASSANAWRTRLDLVTALGACGRADDAAHEFDAVPADIEATYPYYRPLRALARSWVSAAAHAMTKAVAEANRAAVIAHDNAQYGYEVLCLQTATRFGDRTTAQRLADLARLVDGPRAPVAVHHAAALASRDGHRLLEAADEYETMGDLLSAADAAAQAASVFRHDSRLGPALTASERTTRLASACGGAHTPALRHEAEQSNLTDRQHEILALSARGLSHKQIAEQLSVSVRTIEGHLYRASRRQT